MFSTRKHALAEAPGNMGLKRRSTQLFCQQRSDLQDHRSMSVIPQGRFPNLHQSRILLLGDEDAALRLKVQMLRQGAHVTVSLNADCLMEAIIDWQPHLVILLDPDESWKIMLAENQETLNRAGSQVMVVGPEPEKCTIKALGARTSIHDNENQNNLFFMLAQAAVLLLRSGQARERSELDIPGVLHIDPDSHRIHVYDHELQLSSRMFRLFHYLVLNNDKVIYYYDIAMLISKERGNNDHRMLSENAINVQISRLRKVLKTVHAEHWLETVRGVGYRMSLPNSK